jgi:predicted small metal-binding protein
VSFPIRRPVMKVVHCPCGTNVEGESDEELVTNVQQHISAEHPEMADKYSTEQILEMAHDH